jgi:hypothetical protein
MGGAGIRLSKRSQIHAGCQWLTPVILATHKVHRSRLDPANSLKDPISKIPNTKTRLVK